MYDITLLIYPIGENSEMFCKQEMWTPYSYTSNETTLTLDFKSDNEQTRQGFLLSYQIAGTYNVFLQIYIIVMRERERERERRVLAHSVPIVTKVVSSNLTHGDVY